MVALATDPDVARWSGRAVAARDLADEYGFRDVDGRLPPGPMHHDTPDRCPNRVQAAVVAWAMNLATAILAWTPQ